MDNEYSTPYEEEKYTNSSAGDFGTFFTDKKAPVFYLNTSFKIDFIGRISPVREILDVSEVDFDELVQRDLDDFRIRRDIIPYLTDGMGYKFFPPIVAAMTQPSKDKKAIKNFYPTIKTRKITRQNQFDQFEIEFEDSFCVRWFLNSNDQRIDLPVEIRWNSEFTYLMAVDGQHRLVALQAIRGLIQDESLKIFYRKSAQEKEKLKGLKVPVTILFFPNSVRDILGDVKADLVKYFPNIEWDSSTKMDVKQVLRNIFVDVNKSAKQPTKSRTILLDEKDLSAIFSRMVFSNLKETMPNIYTALLEYNSSSGNESKIDKNRPIITTIGIVNSICNYLFEDDQKSDQGSNLRTRLGIYKESEFPESDEFPVNEIKKDNFSLEQRRATESLFRSKWLDKFIVLFTELEPFKILIDEVRNTYKSFEELKEKSSIEEEDYKLYKTLFGSSEKRNIIENNAKLGSDDINKILYKSLKEKEKEIRESVRSYDFFYSLMFQEGFFRGVNNLISSGFLSNDHFMNKDELNNLIIHLNLFINNNPKNSVFDFQDNLNNLIFYRGRAKPEDSKIVGALILLIALNYKRKDDENCFTDLVGVTNEQIKDINSEYVSNIENRMIATLGKDFDFKRENKIRKQEIRMLKDEGKKTEYKKESDIYDANRSEYIDDKIKEFKPMLENQLGL